MLIVNRDQKRHGQYGRVAFIAGKRLGNAVWRNGAKRRMRAICHDLHNDWDGYDVLFVARMNILSAPYQRVLASIQNQIKRL